MSTSCAILSCTNLFLAREHESFADFCYQSIEKTFSKLVLVAVNALFDLHKFLH